MVGMIGGPFRKQPRSNYQTDGEYLLLARSGNLVAQMKVVLDAGWFHDAAGRYASFGNLESKAALEKLVAGTAVYDNAMAGGLENAKWPLPWGEYPLKTHEAIRMILGNSRESWVLRGLRAEAGALVLFYQHVRYQGHVREVLFGQDYRELHLSVSVQGAAKIRVRNKGEVVSERLTQDDSLCITTFALKREAVSAQGWLRRLWESPYVALTMSVKEKLSNGNDQQLEQTLRITGKDYRGLMR